jgi:hypothetical protein
VDITADIKKAKAVKELWFRGELSWKLNGTQKRIRQRLDAIKEANPDKRRKVLFASRRTGKSTYFVVDALEFALKNPRSQIKYISATAKMVKDFLLPLFEDMCADAPPALKPKWIKSEQAFFFSNGSVIRLGGTDSKHFKKLRGQRSDRTYIDEAGFMNDLSSIVKDVLAPQSLTTGGETFLGSSAPDVSGHDFADFVKQARLDGTIVEITIHDRVALTEEEAEKHKAELRDAIEAMGGVGTAGFRREYLNDLSVQGSRSVVPEFDGALQREIVREFERPKYCHKYTCMDLGFSDLTAVLVGFLDFDSQVLYIEDEWSGTKAVTDDIKTAVRALELKHWGAEVPLIRAADAPPLALEELRRSGIDFLKTRNDDPESAINEVRRLLKEKKIVIHPRCEKLVACIPAAVKTTSAKFKLDRHKDHGHYDFLMTLVYLVRNLRRFENPKPRWLGMDQVNAPWIKLREDGSNAIQALKSAFGKVTF